jgi:hypothetical protein
MAAIILRVVGGLLGATYAADSALRAGDQNGSVHVRLSYAKGSSLANTVGRYSAIVG